MKIILDLPDTSKVFSLSLVFEEEDKTSSFVTTQIAPKDGITLKAKHRENDYGVNFELIQPEEMEQKT